MGCETCERLERIIEDVLDMKDFEKAVMELELHRQQVHQVDENTALEEE